ncbi:hypothetical protein [Nonomuraea wenchangensis]|uniref:hypothetical protein n=1 Tax=Nonomuraea wenchangensis TaxID=568860 RepID=UPI00379FE1AD
MFLLAARTGDLAIVAMITALYPAGTVLLARGVLHERIGRGQVAGLATAAVAVSLLPPNSFSACSACTPTTPACSTSVPRGRRAQPRLGRTATTAGTGL